MSNHEARVSWRLSGADFGKGKYSREHTWQFDGGTRVIASASPDVVPIPYSNPAGVDPEEAFVASIASCHMLTFLYLAAREGLVIESYVDDAVGTMTKNVKGFLWLSSVLLSPQIAYRSGAEPSPELEQRLHHLAHDQCFIANSVKTEIVVQSRRA
jgi:organic hydroperoxide reductase OsmC/OhrA